GMVLAAKDYLFVHGDTDKDPEHDGQVRLTKLSLALFSKNTGDGRFPEINTMRSNVAYLKFDQPIVNPADMGKHKIVRIELTGSVDIDNNRRTPQRDDDLTVFTPGPVFYSEEDHHVWTGKTDKQEDPVVEVKDLQSKPDPQTITGYGLDLYLTAEQ